MTDKLVDALRAMFGDRIRLLFTKASAHGGRGAVLIPEIEGPSVRSSYSPPKRLTRVVSYTTRRCMRSFTS